MRLSRSPQMMKIGKPTEQSILGNHLQILSNNRSITQSSTPSALLIACFLSSISSWFYKLQPQHTQILQFTSLELTPKDKSQSVMCLITKVIIDLKYSNVLNALISGMMKGCRWKMQDSRLKFEQTKIFHNLNNIKVKKCHDVKKE